MNDWLNRLFGLSDIAFGAGGTDLAFARPIPPWGWLLAVAMAAALAAAAYWRQDGPRGARLALGAARALLLLLLLLVVSGPQLVRPNERVEKDWVVVLVDRSASLGVPDASVDGVRATRDEQLRRALGAAWPQFELLARDREVVWLGFDGAAYDLPAAAGRAPGAPGVELAAPAGQRTNLGRALDEAMARTAARSVSGVVVFSDGRSFDEPSRETIRRLKADQIPVFVHALGSPEPVTDLAVAEVDAPSLAFTDDTIPVLVDVERLGGSGEAGRAGGRVQLVEKGTGLVLDERPLPRDAGAWSGDRARVVLTTKPRGRAGEPDPATPEAGGARAQTWLVRLVPEGPDLVETNNAAEVGIELVDRQLRVLYIDGYPRWEFRYLKNLLLRERSIRSSTLLLAANRQYLQEGDVLLDALPRTRQEWAAYDVVILGDLTAGLFSRAQLEGLREHVATGAAGLLWIGGPSGTPASWRDTPLADLLPFALTGTEAGAADGDVAARPWSEPVLMRPAPAAARLNLLQLADPAPIDGAPTGEAEGLPGWPAALSDPAQGWPRLHFAQRVDAGGLKPTAEVLAWFVPVSSGQHASSEAPPPEATPAVMTMRYGAGRVMYVGTDEIWRWRYARGETLPERFWLPLLRLQGRDALDRAAKPAVLEVSPRRPQTQQPVSIVVRVQDQSLADAVPDSIAVRIAPVDPAEARAVAPVELRAQPESSEVAGGDRPATRTFRATWTPAEPGLVRVSATDAALAGANLAVDVQVTVPEDEIRHPDADHALLRRVVDEAGPGGAVLDEAGLARLPELLPRREIRIAGTPDVRTLWDRPIVLALLLLLLCGEWIGRRLIKLT